ncbi:zinc finger C-x8-C-x5-C-x3-H type domain-containing protein [Babesia caballi]|uniref:Zinc finger C-x8-C-x5-C-x3-H type domain-containing protein n=1 Tax=Babesia caballi TaxID=5871 RepID=A0AAV4LST6_BABCB|nr:zinc finger C-x8-C-x5-C-x3-H type domain-containing protein [Babesia caballi]
MSGTPKPEVPREVRVISVEQFHKTKICPHMNKPEGCLRSMRGQCPYAHDKSELKEPPNLIKTAMCKLHLKGCCGKSSADCPYAHSFSELRHTDGFYKTYVCKFWEKGYCKAGDLCRYAHGVHEIRKAGSGSTSVRTEEAEGGEALPGSVYEEGCDVLTQSSAVEKDCDTPTITSDYTFNRRMPSPVFVYPTYGEVSGYCPTPTASELRPWVPAPPAAHTKEQEEAYCLMHFYLQKYIECCSKQQLYGNQEVFLEQGYMTNDS